MVLFGEKQGILGLEGTIVDIVLRYPKESVPGPYCLWVLKERQNCTLNTQRIFNLSHLFTLLTPIYVILSFRPLVVTFYKNLLKTPPLWPFNQYIPRLQPLGINLFHNSFFNLFCLN